MKRLTVLLLVLLLVTGCSAAPDVDVDAIRQEGYDAGYAAGLEDGKAGSEAVVPAQSKDTAPTVETVQPAATGDATMGEKNALEQAKSYLSHSAFSYTGLIKQLEYEGYSTEEATYGADNCGADWNQQAAAQAKSYLEHSSFSKSGLIEQLEYEGYTTEQAEYGASQNGY